MEIFSQKVKLQMEIMSMTEEDYPKPKSLKFDRNRKFSDIDRKIVITGIVAIIAMTFIFNLISKNPQIQSAPKLHPQLCCDSLCVRNKSIYIVLGHSSNKYGTSPIVKTIWMTSFKTMFKDFFYSILKNSWLRKKKLFIWCRLYYKVQHSIQNYLNVKCKIAHKQKYHHAKVKSCVWIKNYLHYFLKTKVASKSKLKTKYLVMLLHFYHHFMMEYWGLEIKAIKITGFGFSAKSFVKVGTFRFLILVSNYHLYLGFPKDAQELFECGGEATSQGLASGRRTENAAVDTCIACVQGSPLWAVMPGHPVDPGPVHDPAHLPDVVHLGQAGGVTVRERGHGSGDQPVSLLLTGDDPLRELHVLIEGQTTMIIVTHLSELLDLPGACGGSERSQGWFDALTSVISPVVSGTGSGTLETVYVLVDGSEEQVLICSLRDTCLPSVGTGLNDDYVLTQHLWPLSHWPHDRLLNLQQLPEDVSPALGHFPELGLQLMMAETSSVAPARVVPSESQERAGDGTLDQLINVYTGAARPVPVKSSQCSQEVTVYNICAHSPAIRCTHFISQWARREERVGVASLDTGYSTAYQAAQRVPARPGEKVLTSTDQQMRPGRGDPTYQNHSLNWVTVSGAEKHFLLRKIPGMSVLLKRRSRFKIIYYCTIKHIVKSFSKNFTTSSLIKIN